jgi:hypothetical protein
MKNPNHVGKQGDVKQLGGDFILGPGAVQHYLKFHDAPLTHSFFIIVNQCTYAHLMEHTEDRECIAFQLSLLIY